MIELALSSDYILRKSSRILWYSQAYMYMTVYMSIYIYQSIVYKCDSFLITPKQTR